MREWSELEARIVPGGDPGDLAYESALQHWNEKPKNRRAAERTPNPCGVSFPSCLEMVPADLAGEMPRPRLIVDRPPSEPISTSEGVEFRFRHSDWLEGAVEFSLCKVMVKQSTVDINLIRIFKLSHIIFFVSFF